MIPAALLALSLSGLLNPGPQIETTVTHAAGWRIEKRVDAFAGTADCRLERGDVSVRNGALVLDFGRRTDVTTGRFRIDNGPVRSLGEGLLEVAGGHYPFFDETGTSPNRGKAALPLTYVAAAKTVTVQPSLKRRARTFELSGLPDALSAAKASGCLLPS